MFIYLIDELARGGAEINGPFLYVSCHAAELNVPLLCGKYDSQRTHCRSRSVCVQ